VQARRRTRARKGTAALATSIRRLRDGKTFHRISQAAVPILRVVPSPRVGKYGRLESLGCVLPIDNHSFRIYVVDRVPERSWQICART
jgi:hypothetical protein